MGKKKRKRSSGAPQSTPLAHHKKVGSRLLPPLSQIGKITTTDWARDLLPEHLWLGALADLVGLDSLPRPYNALLDAVDEYWTDDKTVCLGMLSDFGLVATERRGAFLEKHQQLVRELFCVPIGRILAFYPGCPASWLVDPRWLEAGGHLSLDMELGRLRRLVSRLFPGKDEFAGRVRALPLNRLLKHQKVYFAKELPVVDLFPRYPVGLTSDERYRVESTARSAVGMALAQRSDLIDHAWPKLFWRHNHDLVPCRPISVQAIGNAAVSSNLAETLGNCLVQNSELARTYLDVVARSVKSDLYDPTRDEVVVGLFSRLTRLYCLMCENPPLWARDASGIILRCLTDTAIVFAYLVRKASQDEFRRFVEYGEGQEKLLMLQLQDNYPGEESLEGYTAEQLSEHLGYFPPELLDIELGHWTKKDQRRLADEAGLERHYRLVFTPTSSDVHGSWMSLKNTNLVHCAEILHRLHRLPSYVEPPLFLNVADVATDLFLECVQLAQEELAFPQMNQRPVLLRLLVADVEQEGGENSPPNAPPDG